MNWNFLFNFIDDLTKKTYKISEDIVNDRIQIKMNFKHKLKKGDVQGFEIDGEHLLCKVMEVSNKRTILVKRFSPAIYVWTNDIYRLKSIYKVGVTKWQKVIDRVKQQDTTGVAFKPEIVDYWLLDVQFEKEAYDIEKNIHNKLPNRVRDTREFFECDFATVIKPNINNVIKEFNAKKASEYNNLAFPRYYHTQAIDLSVKHFTNNLRGWIQHACATGKTKLGYWIYDAVKKVLSNSNGICVVLVPNKHLNVQTCNSWREMAEANGYHYRDIKIATVNGGETDVFVLSKKLKEFVSQDMNVVFCTYQSWSTLADALEIANILPDMIIYDECHRITGEIGKAWLQCIVDAKIEQLETKLNKKVRRLFMTATPKVIGGKFAYKGMGMNMPQYYGNMIHRYSNTDAIYDNYITPVDVLALEIDNDKITELINKNRKLLPDEKIFGKKNGYSQFFINLHTTLTGIKKGIYKHVFVYANTIARCHYFEEWLIKLAPNYGVKINYIKTLDGNEKVEKRVRILENEFTMAEVGVICSCQCMQEGVSVDIADGIVLLDPKQSLVDIVQIIGRVSRLHHSKSVSSIILPIVYKFINGVPIIKKNNYKKVVEILTNLCASSNDILNIVKNSEVKFLTNQNMRNGVSMEYLRDVKGGNCLSGASRKAIQGQGKREIVPTEIAFNDLISNINFKHLFQPKKAKKIVKNSTDYETRRINDYTTDYIITINAYIRDFSSKKCFLYTKKIKSKEQHILEYSSTYNITKEQAIIELNNFLSIVDIKNKELSDLMIKSKGV